MHWYPNRNCCAMMPVAAIEQLPTHARHFYDIQRLTLRKKICCETAGSPQLLMIVAGGGMELAAGERKTALPFRRDLCSAGRLRAI